MTSAHTVYFLLLSAVVAALILSFVQLWQHPVSTRTFVPQQSVLWYRKYCCSRTSFSLSCGATEQRETLVTPSSPLLTSSVARRREDRRETQRLLDRLAHTLCKTFHVMAVYLETMPDVNHNDILFYSYLFNQDQCQVQIGFADGAPIVCNTGDLLLIPICIELVCLNNPISTVATRHCWKLHPFRRRYRVSVAETNYILQKWRKQKKVKMYVQDKGSNAVPKLYTKILIQ